MVGYIYKITDKNNRCYVGKHKYDKPSLDPSYICSGIYISSAIKKYGIENFSIEMVCMCDSFDELNEKEIFYIKHFDCMYPNGYNLTEGGDGISNPTEAILEKNREWHRGKKPSKETREKRSLALKGRKHSKEWVEKIRKANKGQKQLPATLEASRVRHKGTKWYNDGNREYMLFSDDPQVPNLIRGRLRK